MARETFGREKRGEWMDRSSAPEFNRGSRGESSARLDGDESTIEIREEDDAATRDRAPGPRLDLEPNPFLLEDDERADGMAAKTRELQDRFEQEIQELDEAQIADDADVKNRFLDRLLPAHARDRAERYADAREAKEWELGVGLAELDYREFGAEEPSNDEASYELEKQESEREGLDFEI